MNLLGWIRNIFSRVRVEPMALSYRMDLDEQGRSEVRVLRSVDGQQVPVDDPRALLRYGYGEVTADGRTIYVTGDDDRQTILAVDSLSPEIMDEGAWRFDVTPPVLSYLRKKTTVVESEASQALTILDQPIRPTVKLDFDPRSGLKLEAGYALDDSGALVKANDVPRIGDGRYVRIGNKLAPIIDSLSETGQRLLDETQSHIGFDQIPEFFMRDLVLLKKEFQAVLTDVAAQIEVLDQGKEPVVRIDKSESGWLEFQVLYEVGDHTWAQSMLLAKAETSYVRLGDMTWLKVNPKVLSSVDKMLADLGADVTEGGYQLPIAQFASLEEFISDIGGLREVTAAYAEFLAQLTDFRADRNFQLSQPIEERLAAEAIKLRPYQREGIHWLQWLWRHHLHGLLADDMGLGKTMQSICAMGEGYLRTESTQPSLVVAPKSVLIHWQREIERCLPNVETVVYHGAHRHLMRRLFSYHKPVVFISTYATVTNDIEYIGKVPFFYVILDEATSIKNPSAKRTQSIKALNSMYRLGLSGTPVENRPAELWSVFDFLMRGHLGRYGTFQRHYETAILNGNQASAEALGRRVRPFMLRRLKTEVAKDLPEKIEMTEWCELSAEQRQLYGSLQDEAKRIRDALASGEQVNYTTSILPVITKLKQICDHPALVTERKRPILGRSDKFDWILDKVRNILDGEEQVVLFSHFLGMLDLLQAEVERLGVPWIRIDGQTNNRQGLMDQFNAGGAVVALCSLQAAGYGVTLTGANHVIHADRWWNPAVEDQATDRVHRIGQERTVYVYRILTEGTLEERIDRLLDHKRGMAEQIIGAAKTRGLQWTREELLEILQPLD